MSEDKTKNLDLENEIIDDEEYKKAMEMLNSSKNSRVKKIVDKKKEEKKNDKLKKEEEKNSDKAPSFLDKCKKDPVIPISFILAFLAIIGAALYFVIPNLGITCFDFTVPEFKNKYEQTTLYTGLLSAFDLAIPEVSYTDASALSSVNDEIDKSVDNIQYFTSKVSSSYNTYFQGCTRKSDGKIVYLNILVPYTKENVDSGFAICYMASFFETLNSTSSAESIQVVTEAFANFTGNEDYKVNGNLAYKMSVIQIGEATYISMEILPVKN